MKAALILGTQLLERHPALEDDDIDELLVVESAALFDRLPYHQHKIVLVLSAMRHMVARLEREGRTVRTIRQGEGLSFPDGVARLIEQHDVDGLAWMRAADRGVDRRIDRIAVRAGIRTRRWADRAFLTPEPELDAWFREHPRARMEDFYRWQRQRTGILMEGASPAGGRWNYDADNREPLPKAGIDIPRLPRIEPDAITRQVIDEVRERFPDHPGDARDFWLPVTHDDARAWLDAFVAERLPDFGRYEDAMAADEPFLFHSVLTPALNIGLLTPHDVVDAVLEASGDVPLPSLEGFLRQVIGWREYMRGMYRAHPELEGANALGLTRELEPWWYSGEGMPDDLPIPVRTVLERVLRHGYAHHIERLMVLGSWFLLEGYAPASVQPLVPLALRRRVSLGDGAERLRDEPVRRRRDGGDEALRLGRRVPAAHGPVVAVAAGGEGVGVHRGLLGLPAAARGGPGGQPPALAAARADAVAARPGVGRCSATPERSGCVTLLSLPQSATDGSPAAFAGTDDDVECWIGRGSDACRVFTDRGLIMKKKLLAGAAVAALAVIAMGAPAQAAPPPHAAQNHEAYWEAHGLRRLHEGRDARRRRQLHAPADQCTGRPTRCSC